VTSATVLKTRNLSALKFKPIRAVNPYFKFKTEGVYLVFFSLFYIFHIVILNEA